MKENPLNNLISLNIPYIPFRTLCKNLFSLPCNGENAGSYSHIFTVLHEPTLLLLNFFKLKNFVDGLDEEQQRRLLILVLNNGRGSLDYARRILQNNDPQPESDPPANMQDWCVCGNCIIMPTPDENKCCRQRECITFYELFYNLCIDRHVLELLIRARCDIRVEPLDISMSSFRKAGYRQFIFWEHGYLGKGNRRIIPSCAVNKKSVSLARQCVHGL